MLNLMKTLVAVRGISGREKAISDKLLTIVAPITDKCYNDSMGNLIAVKYHLIDQGKSFIVRSKEIRIITSSR